jgi:hypothetical protein
MVLLVLFGVAVVAALFIRKQQRDAINEGTRLWEAGQHDAAIAKYKEGYPSAETMKGEVLQRIVDYEVAKGNLPEARKWIERGLDEKVDASYQESASTNLLAQVKTDRADKVRRLEEERVAQVKAKDDAIPSLTAAQLFRAYKDNGVAADRDYKDKEIKVSGVVTDIQRDLLDVPYVTLDVGDEALIFEVQCYFRNKQAADLAKLQKGQQITVRGKCIGKVLNVLVKNCTLAQ